MYSYGPPHMAGQKQDDQLEHTFSSYVRIRDVALETYQRWWTIGRSDERGSGISVSAARHDDADDIVCHTVILLVLKLLNLHICQIHYLCHGVPEPTQLPHLCCLSCIWRIYIFVTSLLCHAVGEPIYFHNNIIFQDFFIIKRFRTIVFIVIVICGNSNNDEDNSPKTLNDKNHQASSQKFSKLIFQKVTFILFILKLVNLHICSICIFCLAVGELVL